ncbi:unnamed protein product [Rotaria magnacalcarata]|uniref:Uncharacterized protein n=2 Tax=Rotaria magnacalcarata TaxID=392030 RepID=A0A815WFL5_9BILA|nr:unnamed protein product [Rotaria magnacalcarata]CAF1651735.1 unnamed protein product [Rotaria magnacalcarata]CAF2238603.1 unnamed protein product [Rotaria magnacalcarata]CAF3845191.1 unnamed protein product [Rotaria magnacalcarata]CAF4185824.1 unnamed protein product [Rotaria magnacalcarata]
MTTTKISINPQLSSTLCSQCSSMAHFKCIDHCNDVFCGKCSVKHRTAVTNQMNDLAGQLKLCKIDPVTTHDEIDNNFIRASNQTIRRTRDTVNNLITEIQQREKTIITEIECILEARQEEKKKRTDSALLTSEEAVDYTRLLMNCLKQDQLIDVDTLAAIQRRLEARSALGQSVSEAKTPLIELGKFEPNKLLQLRTAPRAESPQHRTRHKNKIPVTISLDKCRFFQIPLEGTFSVGKHPTAVSLNDRYLETFFCRRTPGNSLILLSSTTIDVVNRGSGVEMSVRLSKILGTEKDKILAGAWCEYSQRLILVGNHRMYFYDLQGQEHAKKFRCEPKHGDPGNTPRFLNCTHDGSIFYAYKSVSNSYIIEKHAYPSFLSKKNDDNDQEDTTHFFQTKQGIKTNDHLAAMCVTHNRIALVYRSFPPDKLLEHFICLLDHDFKNLKYERASLPSDIKWITAIASFGNDDQYLLCDPRGQQLLLYRSTDGILTRRFRIGALNACCLTDGKLVLWLQKQYASSPTGKLHFITAPHLEERTNVSKSLPLLTQK